MSKRIIASVLALAVLLALCACGGGASSQNQSSEGNAAAEKAKTGMLAMLNLSEQEYEAFMQARREAHGQMIIAGYAAMPEDPDAPGASAAGEESDGSGQPQESMGMPSAAEMFFGEEGIIYYDTLDAMLMALKAGDIGSFEIYQNVARYLCAENEDLTILGEFDLSKNPNSFASLLFEGILSNDFSFLLLEENTALRDEFNTAISGMKADGTLDRLTREQIDDLLDGGEIKAEPMPVIDGAETVRIAVTGALPPMDYVAADGTPAGFNTAVLAEISRRINKNIELLVVDSIGRAAALASGTVDAVFWTRTNSSSNLAASQSEEDLKALREVYYKNVSEEEAEVFRRLEEIADFTAYGMADMPEGTIITDPYYSDMIVPVELKK